MLSSFSPVFRCFVLICVVMVSPTSPTAPGSLSPQTPYDNNNLKSPNLLRRDFMNTSGSSLNYNSATSPRPTTPGSAGGYNSREFNNNQHQRSESFSSYNTQHQQQQNQRRSPYPKVSPPAYNTLPSANTTTNAQRQQPATPYIQPSAGSSSSAAGFDSLGRHGYSTTTMSSSDSYGRQMSGGGQRQIGGQARGQTLPTQSRITRQGMHELLFYIFFSI